MKRAAFSLVEVVMALGVVSFALFAILGLLPVGSQSGRDSIDATRTSLIAQAVFDRIHANMTSNDAGSSAYFSPYATGASSFFFFTSEGLETGELLRVQAPNDQPAFYGNVKKPSDFYRAKVTVATLDQTAAYNASDPRKVFGATIPHLLCAKVELGWPVNTADGSISATTNKAKTTYSFLIRRP